VTDAIAYAHSQRVLHRDLKPSNVIVGDFGETVVVDWGLAKSLAETTDATAESDPPYRAPAGGHTIAGAVVGTPNYMSPEQAQAGTIDARADVYSLGALLYHILAGKPPFSGDGSTAVIDEVIAGPPIPVEQCEEGVPPDLAAIVGKAMARDPTQRYASVAALAEDLRRFQTGQLVGAHHYSRSTLARRWLRQYRSSVAVASLMLVVLAVSLSLTVRRILRERNTARIERARAEERAQALTLSQARMALQIDPTAALAWLKKYPANAPDQKSAHIIAADALSRGIARTVLHSHDKVLVAALAPDGQQIVAAGDTGTIHWWQTPEATPRSLTFDGYPGFIQYSHDGRQLVVTADPGKAQLWDLITGTRRDLIGPSDAINVIFAPDDRSLLAQYYGDRIRLWNLADGSNRELDFEATFQLIVYRADGTPLVFVARGPNVDVLDARTSTRLTRLSLPSKTTYFVTSARGDLLLSQVGARLLLSDVASGRAVALFAARAGFITAAISPDGRYVAWSAFDHSVEVFEVATGATRHFEQSHRMVTLTFSPDGNWLAIGLVDGAIRLLDLAGGDAQSLRGHSAAISWVQFSNDGKTLLSAGGTDGTLRLWSVPHPARVLSLGVGAVLSATFSPDGTRVAAASNGGVAGAWDVANGHSLAMESFGGLVQTVSFSPDGHWLASASWDHTVRWLNLDTRVAGTLAHDQQAQRVLWLDNGTTLATSSADGTVARWNVATGSATVLTKHSGEVARLSLSADGGSLLSSGEDGTVRLASISEGASRLVASHAKRAVAEFLPDGKTIASVSRDGSAKLVNLSSGETRILRDSGSALRELRVAPDGARIVAGGDDGALYVWTLPGGTLQRFDGYGAIINRMSFSPDGTFVATAGYDQSAWIWALDTGDATMLRGHDGQVVNVAYSPKGKLLATTGDDSGVRLWTIEAQSMVPADSARFCRWLDMMTDLVIDNQ
jgi:WD40 repeat protein